MRFLKKYWIWALVLLLIPYTYGLWRHSPSHSQTKPDCEYYSETLSRYEVIIAATNDTPQQTKAEQDEKSYLQASVDCSDLHAQWAMADVTWWAFGAGIAGIALVFLTFLYTRSSVFIARASAEKQLRAYLRFDFTASCGSVEGDGELCTHVWIKIHNIGQTPAFNVRATGHCFTADNKAARVPNNSVMTEKIVSGYLAPNSAPATAYFKINDAVISNMGTLGGIIVTGKQYFVFDGFVEFDDVFKKQRRRIYLHRWGKTTYLSEIGKDGPIASVYANHQNEREE